MIHSIRSYLLWGAFLLLSSSSIITLISTSWYTSHEIEEVFDASLVQSARIFHGLVVDHQEQNTLHELQESLLRSDEERFPDTLSTGHPYERKLAFQAWSVKHLLLSTPAYFQVPAPVKTGFQDIISESEAWRIYTLFDESHQLWIRTGQKIEVREDLAEDISHKVMVPILIVLPLLLLAMWLIIKHGLKPLFDIRQAVDQRDSDDLEAITAANLPVELAGMVEAMNHLFARVATTLTMERRFTDDAAHELRTPLAALRVHLDLANLPVSQYQPIAEAIMRMERVVSQLLQLARLEPHKGVLKPALIDPEPVLQDLIAELVILADAKQIELVLNCSPQVWIHSEPTLLTISVRNLVENAIRYTHSGDFIEVNVYENEDGAVIDVCDHGPGIALSEREHVIERFYRENKADSGGAGLGLSIVNLIASLQFCQLLLLDTCNGGLTARLQWKKSLK